MRGERGRGEGVYLTMSLLQEYARSNRKNPTEAENRLWYFLRNRRLNGYKFVREQPVCGYVADFVCREHKLVVELDGGQHGEESVLTTDRKRTVILEKNGYRVIRICNSDLFNNITGVLEFILQKAEAVPS